MVIVRAWCVGALITTFVRLLVNTVFPPPADTALNALKSPTRFGESTSGWKKTRDCRGGARIRPFRSDYNFDFTIDYTSKLDVCNDVMLS
uniref:Secreted protein n=1 Tax=Knipowitschia caucasica TaxID=637954 RepID=A0AAV2JWS9_KNICA